jgi:hypothetical protein
MKCRNEPPTRKEPNGLLYAYMDQAFVTKRQNHYRLGPYFADVIKLSVL